MALLTNFSKRTVSPSPVNYEVQTRAVEMDFSSTNMNTTDTETVMAVDAGTIVTNVRVIVVTAEGGTATIDIGDSGSATRFHSNTDVNTADAMTSASGPHYYSAADAIRVKADNALDAAKIVVIVEFYKVAYTLT